MRTCVFCGEPATDKLDDDHVCADCAYEAYCERKADAELAQEDYDQRYPQLPDPWWTER